MSQKFIVVFVSVLFNGLQILAQRNLLQSGPMVGYSAMKEVGLWVQTTESATVYFIYFDKENPVQRFKTSSLITVKENAFVAQIIAEVQPSKKYQYELYINGKKINRPYPLEFQSQILWRWRAEPPSFKFAFGSCNYVNEIEVDRAGAPYGNDFQIYTSILNRKPDFMIWGGDNIYLREVDWDTRTGILHRNTHTRSFPGLQALLASVHHYAIWDDHDFGPNDADRSYTLKRNTLEAFKLFWMNPSYTFENEGITGSFVWGDAEFFLMDDRYFRSPNNSNFGEVAFFGEKQVQWLLDALKSSIATFKFVVCGGQIINTEPHHENYAKYQTERQRLLQAIQSENIPGVLFLTGDRHYTELSKMERAGSYPLYDFTVSPLTSGASGERYIDEKNQWRVPGTYFGNRNFCIFEISGKSKARVLKATVFDTHGKEIWTREISENELK
ncbi:MAG: alkaline phosphatase D family protein [Microscillaceae bacterium]|nr:alkaline phosphatase D family protein [Microscillaceae bacterium]